MKRLLLILSLLLTLSCSTTPAVIAAPPSSPEFSADRIEADMRFLADDLLEGRDTGSRGHEIAARYVAAEFSKMGLEPAGDDGWFQRVPFVRATATDASFELRNAEGVVTMTPAEDFSVVPSASRPELTVAGPIVFAGYGVIEPDQDWNDYEGLDVDGAIVLVVRNAPASFPSTLRAVNASTLRKLELASERGAVGMIEVTARIRDGDSSTRTSPSLGWPSVRWVEPGGRVHDEEGLPARIRLSDDGAAKLFEAAGRVFDDLVVDVEEGKVAGYPLGISGRLTINSETEEFASPNVLGMVRGTKWPGESLIYVAHLDHIGIRESEDDEDRIYNGAYDNASGVASMLEVARAFAESEERPGRSIVFAAVTGEEKGLLGADYLAINPTDPIGEPVGAISIDMFLMLYPLYDVVGFGAEHSTLGPALDRAAESMGIVTSPDYAPEQTLFVRTDHYPFVRQGVPGLFLVHGLQNGTPETGREAMTEWLRTHYHRPSDDLNQEIDFDAGARFAELNYRLGLEIANAPDRPRWNEGDWFGEHFGSD